MLSSPLEILRKKIEQRSPVHARKLLKNSRHYDELYYQRANSFLNMYLQYIEEKHLTLDYAVECYLKFIADMTAETIRFYQTGAYSSSKFSEVNQRVYANPEIMEYHMHGLLLSQFLWRHHYQMLSYYSETLPLFRAQTRSYLEIGAGHGLYVSVATQLLVPETSFDVVDISPTSLELCRRFAQDKRIKFRLEDVFSLDRSHVFDFITMGEVLEHVEDPVKLLHRLSELLADRGVIFITTPTNAPTIDHIYLFRNLEEIRSVVREAGLRIDQERSFCSEELSLERAEELKVASLYGAFLRKA